MWFHHQEQARQLDAIAAQTEANIEAQKRKPTRRQRKALKQQGVEFDTGDDTDGCDMKRGKGGKGE